MNVIDLRFQCKMFTCNFLLVLLQNHFGYCVFRRVSNGKMRGIRP
jgi:hypothetical protein